MPGVDIPAEPCCTYDDLPEPKEPVEKHQPGEGGIRARYERLEARIAELEGQLREKEMAESFQHMRSQLSPMARMTLQDPFDSLNGSNMMPYPSPYAAPPSSSSGDPSSMFHIPLPSLPMNISFDQVTTGVSPLPTSSTTGPGQQQHSPETPYPLMWSSWPERLPAAPMLTHLVETFFLCHPHANRLLHRPTFMASLRLPPTHADFPALSLLHAICALSSLWSPAVEQEDMPDLAHRPADEIFQEAERKKVREERAQLGLGARGDWFGEIHARFSREEEDKNATEGTKVFQGLQSIVVLTWYYYAHARWVEVWLHTSKALRYAVPMGLNTTPTHGPLLRSWTMPSILGPPKNAIEAEMRRTTFWLAYCYERWQAASTGWAMGLDDEDISQVLSLPQEDFNNGRTLHPELRQRISTPRMLTLHIPEQTDSFTLYVKGTVLFSKVKNFNIRFKSKYYYAVASSSAHGDRFGTFGPQPLSASSTSSASSRLFGTNNNSTAANNTNNTTNQPEEISLGAGSGSSGAHSRGPSPDMAPIATLATSGTLVDDTSLAAEARWHTSPTPIVVGFASGGGAAFSPATTGNPPPGPAGTYGSPVGQGPERIDPRDTPSFRAIDGLIEGFRTSFPKNLRDPVRDGSVDSELYVACLVPHVAFILLHDPHADPSSPHCKSAEKLLNAARAILDLVYILCATSFDITLLDPVASFAWFLAARVFVRFLKARLDGRRRTEAIGLRNELEVIRLALRRMGERVPLGFRQSKMLDDLLANEVGSALDDAVHAFSPEGTENMTLPQGSSPVVNVHHGEPLPFAAGGPRGSFSAPGGQVPNLAHRGSLSVPPRSGINSQRNSFSAQGEGAAAMAHGLPGDGRTKGIMLDQLPSFDATTHSAPDSANTLQTPFAFGVADIHHKFLESMKSQDEREMAENGQLSGGGGAGRLEMLLGEMVEDGDGDGMFGGVAGMGVLGAMGSSGLGIGAGIGIAGSGYVNDFGGVGVGW